MDLSIAELNIALYRKLLSTDLDGAKRSTVEALLAAEQAKLAQIISDRRGKPAGHRGHG
jgi:hypothetical protein